MRSLEQIVRDIESLRRSHASAYGHVYDDGQVEAMLFGMVREKMVTSMKSTLQGYSAAELLQAMTVLHELKVAMALIAADEAAQAAAAKRGKKVRVTADD